MHAGDIIGFSGRGLAEIIINLGSFGIPFWDLSHVGILADYEGELLLFESTTLSDLPCVIQGKPCAGVQAVRLEDRLEAFNGRAWHYPLTRWVCPAKRMHLTEYLVSRIGITYDMPGAIQSGGFLFSLLESIFRGENLSTLFCSELCAAVHRDLGILNTGNASKWTPNKLVRYERRQGILQQPRRLK